MASEHKDLIQQEFQYYLDHQAELVGQYDGRVIVLKGSQVLGVYESELDALTETAKGHKEGTFLIQRVSEGSEAYSQTFHSRVSFP